MSTQTRPPAHPSGSPNDAQWVRPGERHRSGICSLCWRRSAVHGEAICGLCRAQPDQYRIPCACSPGTAVERNTDNAEKGERT